MRWLSLVWSGLFLIWKCNVLSQAWFYYRKDFFQKQSCSSKPLSLSGWSGTSSKSYNLIIFTSCRGNCNLIRDLISIPSFNFLYQTITSYSAIFSDDLLFLGQDQFFKRFKTHNLQYKMWIFWKVQTVLGLENIVQRKRIFSYFNGYSQVYSLSNLYGWNQLCCGLNLHTTLHTIIRRIVLLSWTPSDRIPKANPLRSTFIP